MASNAENELMDLERAVSDQHAYIYELVTGPVSDPYELAAAREDLAKLEARKRLAYGDMILAEFDMDDRGYR